MPDLTITPDIWRLRSMFREVDHHRGYGIHLDGAKAVATDGWMLIAFDHAGPAMPPTWRLEFVSPDSLETPSPDCGLCPGAVAIEAEYQKPAEIEVPLSLGLHAVEISTGGIAVVRIYDCGEAYPNWRDPRMGLDLPRAPVVIGLSIETVRRFCDSLPTRSPVIEVHPQATNGALSPLVMRSGLIGMLAVIMPARLD